MNLTKIIRIRLSPALLKILNKSARERADKSLSAVVRLALENHFNNKEAK